MPVGSTKSIPLDIRIIAATNRKLKDMLKTGSFRQDLYYRLSVTTINVPPLRERIEDIIPLSNFFLEKYNQQYGPSKKIGQRALRLLLAHDWPGNVRELENLVESLVITSEEDTISGRDVEEYIFDEAEPANGEILYRKGSLAAQVEAYECQVLRSAYEKYGDSGAMARELQTTRSTINRKLKKYNIR